MEKPNSHGIMKNLFKLFLSAVAVSLSVWLLVSIEQEPGIAHDAAYPFPLAGSYGGGKTLAVTEGISDAAKAQELSEFARQMLEDFAAAQAVNEDAVGWLWIPNVCYYPLVYSPVSDYYLTHNMRRENSAQGAIFINFQCEPNVDGELTLIHGHNMKNGTMFGQLDAYLSEDFFQNNDPILIYDGKQLVTYQPFTVLIVEENDDVIDARTMTEDARKNIIHKLYSRSLCVMAEGNNPDFTRNVVFFSTCDYSFSEARLLVGAYATHMEEVDY